MKVYIMFIPIPIKIKYAAPGMLIALWAISIAGDIPLGNIAHLGGLLAGLGYGLYLKKRYKKKVEVINKRFSWIIKNEKNQKKGCGEERRKS